MNIDLLMYIRSNFDEFGLSVPAEAVPAYYKDVLKRSLVRKNSILSFHYSNVSVKNISISLYRLIVDLYNHKDFYFFDGPKELMTTEEITKAVFYFGIYPEMDDFLNFKKLGGYKKFEFKINEFVDYMIREGLK